MCEVLTACSPSVESNSIHERKHYQEDLFRCVYNSRFQNRLLGDPLRGMDN
jgi:hypothetical protein